MEVVAHNSALSPVQDPGPKHTIDTLRCDLCCDSVTWCDVTMQCMLGKAENKGALSTSYSWKAAKNWHKRFGLFRKLRSCAIYFKWYENAKGWEGLVSGLEDMSGLSNSSFLHEK